MDQQSYKYFAFISYSRKDSPAAQWLQDRLEWFRVPVKLVPEESRPGHPKYIRPVYRDKRNLKVGVGNYWEDIRNALDESHFLIVLCSTDSAKSKPVDKEIRHFLDNPNRSDALSKLAPVRLRGNVNSGDETECLCPALLDLGKALTERNLPTMVPDGYENEKEGWERGFAELASFLLNLDPKMLKNHIERKKKEMARRAFWLAVLFGLLTAAAIAAGVVARSQRNEAINQRDRARHEEGVAWLERANSFKRQALWCEARMCAAKAIGASKVGRENLPEKSLSKLPILLRQDSKEFDEARSILDNGVNVFPVFSAKPLSHTGAKAFHALFSPDQRHLIFLYPDGEVCWISTDTGRQSVFFDKSINEQPWEIAFSRASNDFFLVFRDHAIGWSMDNNSRVDWSPDDTRCDIFPLRKGKPYFKPPENALDGYVLGRFSSVRLYGEPEARNWLGMGCFPDSSPDEDPNSFSTTPETYDVALKRFQGENIKVHRVSSYLSSIENGADPCGNTVFSFDSKHMERSDKSTVCIDNLIKLTHPTSELRSCAISPDGRFAVLLGEDGMACAFYVGLERNENISTDSLRQTVSAKTTTFDYAAALIHSSFTGSRWLSEKKAEGSTNDSQPFIFNWGIDHLESATDVQRLVARKNLIDAFHLFNCLGSEEKKKIVGSLLNLIDEKLPKNQNYKPNGRQDLLDTLLLRSVSNKDAYLVRCILDLGANPNSSVTLEWGAQGDDEARSQTDNPVSLAFKNNENPEVDCGVIQALLEHGADVSTCNFGLVRIFYLVNRLYDLDFHHLNRFKMFLPHDQVVANHLINLATQLISRGAPFEDVQRSSAPSRPTTRDGIVEMDNSEWLSLLYFNHKLTQSQFEKMFSTTLDKNKYRKDFELSIGKCIRAYSSWRFLNLLLDRYPEEIGVCSSMLINGSSNELDRMPDLMPIIRSEDQGRWALEQQTNLWFLESSVWRWNDCQRFLSRCMDHLLEKKQYEEACAVHILHIEGWLSQQIGNGTWIQYARPPREPLIVSLLNCWKQCKQSFSIIENFLSKRSSGKGSDYDLLLAHVMMLNGHNKESLDLHRKCAHQWLLNPRKLNVNSPMTEAMFYPKGLRWKQQTAQDFVIFRGLGIDFPVMKDIESLLEAEAAGADNP